MYGRMSNPASLQHDSPDWWVIHTIVLLFSCVCLWKVTPNAKHLGHQTTRIRDHTRHSPGRPILVMLVAKGIPWCGILIFKKYSRDTLWVPISQEKEKEKTDNRHFAGVDISFSEMPCTIRKQILLEVNVGIENHFVFVFFPPPISSCSHTRILNQIWL